MKFDNSYTSLPKNFYSESEANPFAEPQLLAFNEDLAIELGIDMKEYSNEELAEIFSGQKILDGMCNISMVYAAHQFGHFAGRLGDGRAMLLGEVVNPQGKRFDIQLKGSGPTEYSRNGDGLSALGPVVREYVVSEAMYHLGVPGTRALAAVATGEQVFRRTVEPGGVFTRVASSHIRIGTFQYFASTGDNEGLQALLDYTIDRHYPEIRESKEDLHPGVLFLREVIKKQSELVSQWMSLGFIHGVMNTDNTTVSGETIDFGPCAFMDIYKANKVFSSIDRGGRYAYNQQSSICGWNMCRLADCLIALVHEDSVEAVKILNQELSTLPDILEKAWWRRIILKFGLSAKEENREDDDNLTTQFFEYMEKEELDFTLAFRNLSNLLEKDSKDKFFPETDELKTFLKVWRVRIEKEEKDIPQIKEEMDAINPLYIARNHQVEKAIQASYQGDLKIFHELNKVLQNPYTFQPDLDRYSLPPRPEEEVKATFCGT